MIDTKNEYPYTLREEVVELLKKGEAEKASFKTPFPRANNPLERKNKYGPLHGYFKTKKPCPDCGCKVCFNGPRSPMCIACGAKRGED